MDAKSGLMILQVSPLPGDIVKLGADGVNRIWREAKLRGAGIKRAKTQVAAAEHSIGKPVSTGSSKDRNQKPAERL